MRKYPTLSSLTLSLTLVNLPNSRKKSRIHPSVSNKNRTKSSLHFPSEIRSLRTFRQMSRPRSSPQFQLSKKESFRDDESASRNTHSSRQKQGKCGFTRKCGRLVKEQRARFYIMRRCVVMLICWTDNNHNSYSDHS